MMYLLLIRKMKGQREREREGERKGAGEKG